MRDNSTLSALLLSSLMFGGSRTLKCATGHWSNSPLTHPCTNQPTHPTPLSLVTACPQQPPTLTPTQQQHCTSALFLSENPVTEPKLSPKPVHTCTILVPLNPQHKTAARLDSVPMWPVQHQPPAVNTIQDAPQGLHHLYYYAPVLLRLRQEGTTQIFIAVSHHSCTATQPNKAVAGTAAKPNSQICSTHALCSKTQQAIRAVSTGAAAQA